MQKSITLLAILLVVTGCGSNTASEKETFRTGTQGIELSIPKNSAVRFLENQDDISDANNEEMILELHNKGAGPSENTLITELKLWSGGYDPQLLDIFVKDEGRLSGTPAQILLSEGVHLTYPDEVPELEPKTEYSPSGGKLPLILTISPNKLPPGITTYSPTISFALSYEYDTYATEQICFDPNPKSTRAKERACEFTRAITLESQGAPVAVTRIEQDITGGEMGKAIYRLYFENKGKGKVLSPNANPADPGDRPVTLNPFQEGFKLNHLNRIRIDSITLGNLVPESCRPNPVTSEVTLIDNRGLMVCELQKDRISQQAIEIPLSVVVRYAYTDSITHQIEIEKE